MFKLPKQKTKQLPFKKKHKWARYNPVQGKKRSESIFSAPKRVKAHEFKKSTISPLAFLNKFFDFRFNHDKRLFIVFLLLLAIGIISIYSSTIVFAFRYAGGNKFYYLIRHIEYIGVGFMALSVFYFIRPEIIAKFWWGFLSISIFLLVYILVLSLLGHADEVNGATRWVNVGQRSFQPSDFAKLSFMIFIAAFLSNRKTHYKDFKEYLYQNLIPFSFWFFLVLLLILLGKNLGTTLVVGFIGVMCYGVSCISKYHKWGFILLLVIMAVGGLLFALKEGYRMDRVAVWMNYLKTNNFLVEKQGVKIQDDRAYQFEQGLISLGTGGATGVGIGQSIGKFYFVQTSAGDDSIISIMGEEMGFVIVSIVLLLYLYFIYICISISKDFIGKPIYFYLMIGASSWIGFQTFVHVGANIGVVPLTGQTLPFISLGGSSLISLMSAMGLILNVSKQRNQKMLEKQEEISEFERFVKRPSRQFTMGNAQ